MIDIARDLLSFTDALPLWLASILIGWGVSTATTQPAKFLMPIEWPERMRSGVSYIIAVSTAGFPAMLWMIDGGAGFVATVMTTVAAGLWSPLAFSILQRWLRSSPRTAGIADILSGDVRRSSP